VNNTTTDGADNCFALIPDWVLFSEISSQAIRLYLVLSLKAQSDSSYPSPASIINDLHAKSLTAVQRAIKELVKIGALVIHQGSNNYTVITQNPNNSASDSAVE
jgi:hypothetical protein